MRSFVFVVGMLAAFPAYADGLLDKGRKLEQQGKHAEAIVAFEEYLKSKPDDPVGNAELGWAAYGAKNYVKAEAATRRAIAHAPKPMYVTDPHGRTRGAAFYNLGMIQEAQGKPKDAAVSYSESVKARPSRMVREKLQKLDRAAAATVDALAPQRLLGPFPTIRDACRQTLKLAAADADTDWGGGNHCGNLETIPITTSKLAAPYLEVAAFQMIARSDLDIAVRLQDGWYLLEVVGKQARWTTHCGGTRFHVQAISSLKRAVPELRVEYTSQGGRCFHHGQGHTREWGWEERGIVVIGVGPSRKPSAVPPVPTRVVEWDELDDEPRMHRTDATLSLTWRTDGALDVAARSSIRCTSRFRRSTPTTSTPSASSAITSSRFRDVTCAVR